MHALFLCDGFLSSVWHFVDLTVCASLQCTEQWHCETVTAIKLIYWHLAGGLHAGGMGFSQKTWPETNERKWLILILIFRRQIGFGFPLDIKRFRATQSRPFLLHSLVMCVFGSDCQSSQTIARPWPRLAKNEWDKRVLKYAWKCQCRVLTQKYTDRKSSVPFYLPNIYANSLNRSPNEHRKKKLSIRFQGIAFSKH